MKTFTQICDVQVLFHFFFSHLLGNLLNHTVQHFLLKNIKKKKKMLCNFCHIIFFAKTCSLCKYANHVNVIHAIEIVIFF